MIGSCISKQFMYNISLDPGHCCTWVQGQYNIIYIYWTHALGASDLYKQCKNTANCTMSTGTHSIITDEHQFGYPCTIQFCRPPAVSSQSSSLGSRPFLVNRPSFLVESHMLYIKKGLEPRLYQSSSTETIDEPYCKYNVGRY